MNASARPSNGLPRPFTEHLLALTPQDLAGLLKGHGYRPFHAKQIMKWVYENAVYDYENMTDLSKALRAELSKGLLVLQSRVASRQDAEDGVIKLLLAWRDGAMTECVMIPDGERRTACISTQVGCPVGCVFCASGLDGLQRQLTAGEIVEQAVRVRDLCGHGTRLSNVVLMGLGEPLANYGATVAALRTINADWGLGIGARRITVSTVGLPSKMKRLAEENLQVTLALSLHAPTDALRERIIPWAKRVRIEALIEACRYYFDRTGREVTLEYILLGGLNDGESQAHEMVALVRTMRANVNLIAYNVVQGLPYARPSTSAVGRFQEILRSNGVKVKIRRSRGMDIDAACGQLRRRRLNQMDVHVSD